MQQQEQCHPVLHREQHTQRYTICAHANTSDSTTISTVGTIAR
jgi:hypothetical protein